MKFRLVSLCAACAVLTGSELYRALDVPGVVNAQQPRRMMGSFTSLPPLNEPADTSAFGGERKSETTSDLWAWDSRVACPIDPLTGRGLWSVTIQDTMPRVPFNISIGSFTNGASADVLLAAPAVRSALPLKLYQLSANTATLAGETRPAGLADNGADVAIGDIDDDGEAEIVVAVGPHVSIHQVSASVSYTFQPFPSDYLGSVRVALGNVNRRGGLELGVAMATGGEFRLYKAANGIEVTEIGRGFPLGPSHTAGFHLSLGDVNGDCAGDLTVGAATGVPHIRMFNIYPGFLGEPIRVLGDFKVTETGTTGARVTVGKLKGEPYVVAVADRQFYQYNYFDGVWRRNTAFESRPFGTLADDLSGVAIYTPPEPRLRF